MAWRKLAAVLGNARLPESERVAAAMKAYQYRDRLPEIERHLADAFYFFAVDYDPERVVAAYRAVLQLDPTNDAALNNLAIELSRRGKHDEAAALVERAMASGTGASFYSVLTNTRLDQGRVDDALAVVDRMRRELPDAPDEPLLRAGVLARMGQYDSAEAILRTIMVGNPPPSVAQATALWLQRFSVLRGRLGAADRENDRFRDVARNRRNRGALLGAELSQVLTQVVLLRDTAAARRTLAAAEERLPLDSLAPEDRPYAGLVMANAMAGNLPRAKQLAAEYARETPKLLQRDSADAQWMRVSLAIGEGRPGEAVAAIRAARAYRSCVRCYRYQEGLAWEALGQPDSAIAAYQVALGVEDDLGTFAVDAYALPQVRRQLGALYEARGERARAVEQYTAFLDLWRGADPELQPQVREVKERLAGLVGEGAR
jgi:tetratricopeptide (TPR) repeat protein